jgi:hypothetical protein
VNIYYLSPYYSKITCNLIEKGGNNDQRSNDDFARDGKH